jgi:DNA polymerase-4
LGKTGGMLHDYANGRDDSPVRSAYADQDLKSVGNGTTFDHNLVGYQEILSGIMPLCDEVAARMRKYGVKCQVLSVQIKDPKFRTISRQKTLASPTHLTREIADTAMELIRSSWKENAPVRSITITGSNLVASDQAVEQLSFFEGESKEDRQRYEKLDETVDQIRKKFGKGAIGLGGSIRSEEDP